MTFFPLPVEYKAIWIFWFFNFGSNRPLSENNEQVNKALHNFWLNSHQALADYLSVAESKSSKLRCAQRDCWASSCYQRNQLRNPRKFLHRFRSILKRLQPDIARWCRSAGFAQFFHLSLLSEIENCLKISTSFSKIAQLTKTFSVRSSFVSTLMLRRRFCARLWIRLETPIVLWRCFKWRSGSSGS